MRKVSGRSTHQGVCRGLVHSCLHYKTTVSSGVNHLLHFLSRRKLSRGAVMICISSRNCFLNRRNFFSGHVVCRRPLHVPFIVHCPGRVPTKAHGSSVVLGVSFTTALTSCAKISTPSYDRNHDFHSGLGNRAPHS